MRCDNFSLMRGGATHGLLWRLGLIDPGSRAASWLALGLFLLMFMPLAMACTFSGTLWSMPEGMPLLRDYAALGRYFIAMPLLVLLAPPSDRILRNCARQLVHSALVAPAREDDLARALQRVRHWRDSLMPELACLVLALLPIWLPGSLAGLPGIPTWSASADGTLSQAGLWQMYLSMPLFRFIVLIWTWRLVLWTYLLWQLPRIRLDLHPTHPDGAGGLGFLGMAQERFAALSLANGFVLSGALANHMVYMGETLFGLRHLLAGFVIGSSVLVLSPLLFLTPTLLRAKRHALLKYDALGNRTARSFDRRWPRGRAAGDERNLLDAPDSSAMADFTAVYATIKTMPPLPVNRWTCLRVLMYAAAPLLPLALLNFSVDELTKRLFGLMF